MLKAVLNAGVRPWIPRFAACFAAAFAAYYYILHELLGLLAVDEIYFAHVFWLIRQGQTIYTDFYANHLPAYFYLLGPLLPGGGPTDLTFVWVLRLTSLLVVAAYVALLWSLSRRDFLYLLPFLFLFIVLGRMSEIRPDTVGLLLVNAGWWLLLKDSSRRNILLAAALTALALAFSARAGVVAVGMGLLLAWLCWQRRDWRTHRMLVGAAALFAVIAGGLYLLNPAFEQMVRLVYLEPIAVMPNVPLWLRLLPADRLLMVALIVIALVAAGVRRHPVILIACGTQLLLILLDPSPYQYVYGWAAIPTLAGLALLADRAPRKVHEGLAMAGFTLSALVLVFSLAEPTQRPGSLFRLTFDRTFTEGELANTSTAELMRLSTTSQRQQGLWNQLALYGEICRRVPGPVLTKFYANMICQKDALYDWAGLQWPPIFDGDASTASRQEFEKLFASNPPALVAWGKQHYTPKLDPWGRALLADYDIYDGYALKRQR